VSLGRYSILVVCVAVGTLALAWPLALRRLPFEAQLAVALGAAIALVNTLSAHALAVWSSGRSTTAFLRAVLGGMVGRMAAMLAAVVAGILWLGLPKLPLAFSLLSYFLVFLVMELSMLHRQTSTPAAVPR
jgi:hypothetical protein